MYDPVFSKASLGAGNGLFNVIKCCLHQGVFLRRHVSKCWPFVSHRESRYRKVYPSTCCWGKLSGAPRGRWVSWQTSLPGFPRERLMLRRSPADMIWCGGFQRKAQRRLADCPLPIYLSINSKILFTDLPPSINLFIVLRQNLNENSSFYKMLRVASVFHLRAFAQIDLPKYPGIFGRFVPAKNMISL